MMTSWKKRSLISHLREIARMEKATIFLFDLIYERRFNRHARIGAGGVVFGAGSASARTHKKPTAVIVMRERRNRLASTLSRTELTRYEAE